MIDNHVKRLRDLVGQYIGDADIDDELSGAADRIEKLEAALREIDRTSENWIIFSYAMFVQTVRNITRKALEGKDD